MKIRLVAVVAAGALALAGGVAFAQMHGSGMTPGQGMMPGQGMQHGGGMMQGMQGPGGMGHGGMAGTLPQGDQGPASLAYHGINAKMHEGMNISFTGNADADFVKGMIPHHQGAVDMAKVVLAFGKDPEVRKLAEAIVKSQEQEIDWMKTWLQKSGR